MARLAKLEVEKLRAEKEKLELSAEELRKILSDEVLFKSKIQEDLEKIAKKLAIMPKIGYNSKCNLRNNRKSGNKSHS